MSRTVRRLNPVRVNRSGRTQVVYARSGRTMDTYSTGRVTAVCVVSSLHYYRVDRTTNSQECVSLYMYIHIYMYMRVCIYVYVYTYITCFFGASTCRLAHAPLRSDSLITLELTHLPNHRRRVSLVVQLASLFTYSSLLYIPLSRPARSLRVVSHSRTIRMLDSRSTDP